MGNLPIKYNITNRALLISLISWILSMLYFDSRKYATLMRLDKMCLCNLSPKLRDLRRVIKDSEEDPIVPRAPREIFIYSI